MLTAVMQGYIGQPSTGDNGKTSSNHLSFGSGSSLDSSYGSGHNI